MKTDRPANPALTAALTLTLTLVTAGATPPARVTVHPDGDRFALAGDHTPFLPWGFNYDHDDAGRLIEDYWHKDWETVAGDFAEMRDLGANTVRVHLQLARFMQGPDTPDPDNLGRLSDLVTLAADHHLVLIITGLGCYHKDDAPVWYDALEEAARWDVQARFWHAVAETCAASPARHAVFAYDLMNEPVLPGPDKPAASWLAGDFAGKHFVQYLTRDLAGRSRHDVAAAWVEKMASAARAADPHTLLTVGVIPWAMTFPGATPLFYHPDVGAPLDFASIHVYPESGGLDRAVQTVRSFATGHPVLVGETFPLRCSVEELDTFLSRVRPDTAGTLGFYWGKTPEAYSNADGIAGAMARNWLTYFRSNKPAAVTRTE